MGKSVKRKKHKIGRRRQKNRKLARSIRTRVNEFGTKKFWPTDSILIIGEADFSFTLAFIRRHGETDLISTSYDTLGALSKKYGKANLERNLQQIRAKHGDNTKIMHSVDAGLLHETFPSKKFDHIIFNFPHTGSQRVHKNRILLKNFFNSCSKVMKKKGKVNGMILKGDAEFYIYYLVTLKISPPVSAGLLDYLIPLRLAFSIRVGTLKVALGPFHSF